MLCMMEQQSHLRCKPHHFSPEALVNFSRVVGVRTSEKRQEQEPKTIFVDQRSSVLHPPRRLSQRASTPQKLFFQDIKRKGSSCPTIPGFQNPTRLPCFPPQGLTVRPGKITESQ